MKQRIEGELSDDWLQMSTEISGTNPAEVLAAFYEPTGFFNGGPEN